MTAAELVLRLTELGPVALQADLIVVVYGDPSPEGELITLKYDDNYGQVLLEVMNEA